MKRAQTLMGVTHPHTHGYFLQNKIEKNYIKNVVISMNLKLNDIDNKDSNYVHCT